MKRLIPLLFILSFFIQTSAQVITFRTGYYLPYYSEPSQPLNTSNVFAEQSHDDGYYIAGKRAYDTIMTFIKSDKYGKAVLTKKMKVSGRFEQMILSSANCFYMCLGNSLYKLDQEFNLLWTKQIDTANRSYSIIESNNNLIIGSISSAGEIRIRKVDFSGNILWSKAYYTKQRQPSFRGIILRDIAAQGFALLINQRLYRFSSAGDSMWCTTFERPTLSFIPHKSGYFITGDNVISKLDLNGKKLWDKSSRLFYDICISSDDNFVCAGFDLYKFNSDGDTLWTKPISGKRISSSRDNGFVISKLSDYSLSFYKTDESGNYQEIYITSPYTAFEKNISIGTECTLEWQKKNVETVNINFSSDQGTSWTNIAQNVTGTSYLWLSPSIQMLNCTLKISDSKNDFVSSTMQFNITYNKSKEVIAVNRISMFFGNDGLSSHDNYSDGSGLFWPDDSLSAVYTDGLVWGGIVNGEIRVNGSTYRTGLKPGVILSSGKAGDPSDITFNIWKLQKDFKNIDDKNNRNIYEYNYQNWPAELGAPYDDVNGDGKFSRNIDQPKIYGDETFWFAANDLDTNTSKFCYGSDPIGLEMQCTIYGYNRTDELGDVIFKRYKLINKGPYNVDSTFLCYFVDPDLGYALDDYVGCDTLLNLGYCYNADNYDESFYLEAPPSIGYCILQGAEEKYMTRFSPNLKSFFPWHDPYMGVHEGALHFYNYMNGKCPDGEPLVDPVTGDTTIFGLSGDPVAGIGWYEGHGWPGGPEPADRRMNIITGPFNFAPGDTQEVVYAIVLARGTDNINSVKVLKDKVKAVRNFHYNGILNNTEYESDNNLDYSLEQNYPNPFNPSTSIRYSLPEKTNVELKVFDILGKEVAILVNEQKQAGNYQVNFIANKYSSAVYYYQLKTDKFISSKKMILLK